MDSFKSFLVGLAAATTLLTVSGWIASFFAPIETSMMGIGLAEAGWFVTAVSYLGYAFFSAVMLLLIAAATFCVVMALYTAGQGIRSWFENFLE